MSWTAPRTWVAGEKPTAATMNIHIRDNLISLDERHKSNVVNTTTNASGQVTVTHGGTTTPKTVIPTGRNAGHYPYLTALNSTTFQVTFVSRSTGAALTSATSVSFDWACDF